MVEDPSSWPQAVHGWAEGWVRQLDGWDGHTTDLPLPFECGDTVRDLLCGYKVRAFHCTRLLPYETEWIRREGLRPLTQGLLTRRIEAAHARGLITTDTRDELRATNVFATGNQDYRENQVCFVLTLAHIEEDPGSVERLLSTWGGEGIYMGGYVADDSVRLLGEPTIVVAAVELAPDRKLSYTAPCLARLFVGVLAGSEALHGDLHQRGGDGVAAEDIVAIWQPGHPAYDRLMGLPRS